MTVIRLRFPAGRFHATPWNRHVNEGGVEWPPSPWRLLRALIATWYLKSKSDLLTESKLRGLVAKLVSALPTYQLPRATASHTRHFMPDRAAYHTENGKKVFGPNRIKVFDTFLHPAGALEIAWPIELDDSERAALDMLLKNLGYFGRAESLVEARLLVNGEAIEPNAAPLREEEMLAKGHEIVRLLAPMSADVYESWRERLTALQSADATTTAKGGKKRAAKKPNAAALPADIFHALHADTGELQAAGWSLPPGAKLVNYTRPQHIFEVEPIHRAKPARKTPLTVARYAVASAVLLRLTQAISVSERVHQSLVKFLSNAPVFTGRAADGSLMTGHRHAHIFCESSGERRNAITHVTVYAPMGFDANARGALKRLRSVWGHGGHDLQLVLLGIGEPGEFVGDGSRSLFGKASAWQSLTPFVPTRHPKHHRDGRPKLDADGWHIGSPEHDLRRLILERGDLPAPTKIERRRMIEVSGQSLRCIQFQRQRKHGDGLRGDGLGYSFRVVFPKPVTGPLTFGYGAHFGLGLLVPV